MVTDELVYRIKQHLGLPPTTEQLAAMHTFAEFITDRDNHATMILRGCAGTGKTSLAAAIVRTMVALEQKVMLLAPTGRAAKIFSFNSGCPAFTIHHQIYVQQSFGADGGSFCLNFNRNSDTLFLVDESSMIANQTYSNTAFGSGCLLDDLIQFVYGGRNCRMVFIGDQAQLPPVGNATSPALQADILSCYGLKVYESNMNEVLRQSQQSGILFNATHIRNSLTTNQPTDLPQIHFKGFADIHVIPGDELIESLHTSYHDAGIDETIVITRSNKRANIYNQGIRNTILGREEELTTGDMLMIVKNNYYWLEKAKANSNSPTTTQPNGQNTDSIATTRITNPKSIAFLANGDRALVQRVRNVRSIYGFRFADVWLQFPDGQSDELQATLLLDSLNAEAPSLTSEQNQQLFEQVMADYMDLPTKKKRIEHVREDPFYNALQVKYAYAITCHKAQGGQWEHVYIDQGYITDDMLTPDYIRWLYTAFTRAASQLFLVNWPKKQTQDNNL